jgi:hypothetical protein
MGICFGRGARSIPGMPVSRESGFVLRLGLRFTAIIGDKGAAIVQSSVEKCDEVGV